MNLTLLNASEAAKREAGRGQLSRRGLLQASGAIGLGMGVAGLAGCAADTTVTPDASDNKPRRGGRLRTGHVGGGLTETLDPQRSLNLIDEARARQLYDTLTFFNPDWTIAYQLAESMEPDASGTQFQLKLRKGVTFHDGKPFTADDVLYTWRRILDPETASGGAAALAALDLERTSKVNDHEIMIILKSPQIDLPSLLTGREQSIVQAGATDFTKPVGTGPFEFVSFTAGQRSLFKRNPNYWMDGEPYVDELEMISIPDNTSRLNALMGGQVDAIENLLFTDARAHQDDKSFRVMVSPSAACMPFYMQMDQKPFDSPDVRKAMRLAVNRKKTVDIALAGLGDVGNDLFGLGTALYDSSIPQMEYDPDQAKSLLRKAGYEGLTVDLNCAPVFVGQVEACQAYAQQALAAGITVNVKKHDVDTFNAKIYNQVPLAQTYWNFPPEIMFPFALAKNAPYNETHYSNPAFFDMYEQSQRTVDPAARKQIFAEMQQELWDDNGYINWGFIKFTDALANNVGGFTPHPYFNLGAFQFRSWWLNN